MPREAPVTIMDFEEAIVACYVVGVMEMEKENARLAWHG